MRKIKPAVKAEIIAIIDEAHNLIAEADGHRLIALSNVRRMKSRGWRLLGLSLSEPPGCWWGYNIEHDDHGIHRVTMGTRDEETARSTYATLRNLFLTP
jgi:hypothetical protein